MRTQCRLLPSSRERPEVTHSYTWYVLSSAIILQTILICVSVYVSGVPGARMCWKLRLFRDQVVIRYGVILVGWPSDVPFWNFSNKGGPNVVHLRAILDRLTADPPQLYFTPATEKQLHMARLSSGGLLPSTLHPECPPLPNFGRSDIGRRHTKYDKEGSAITPRHVRDGPKSVKMIEAEPKDEVVDANTQPRATGPLPQIRNMFGHLGWYETGWQDLEQEREFAVERGL